MMSSAVDYLAMLEHSWRYNMEMCGDLDLTRLEFLSQHVFDFTTYDGDQDEKLATKAVEVCKAITTGQTYEYISLSDDNRTWYTVMCNLPFFAGAISWGSSIRGAWWSEPLDNSGSKRITLETAGLWSGDEQVVNPTFSLDEWKRFIVAVIEFAGWDKKMGG